MGAVVRELYVFRQRGQPGEAVESAWFRRGIGMEGDRHAAGGERQTSLLAGETRDWMECFPECIYHEKGVFCRLSAGAIFLEVIRDGYVSVSDEIMKLGKKEEL